MRITIDLSVVKVKQRAKSHLPIVVHFIDRESNRFVWTTAVDKGLQEGQKVAAQVSVNEELHDEEGQYVRISHVAILHPVDELKETTYTKKPFQLDERSEPSKNASKGGTEDLLNNLQKTLELLQKK